jgi:Ca2+-binding RTX toxin-like protein
LIGDDGPNELDGGRGDDEIDGRGGEDSGDAGDGDDVCRNVEDRRSCERTEP